MTLVLTLPQLAKQVQTETDAYILLEKLRWGNDPACPRCDSGRVRRLRPQQRPGWRNTNGSITERRLWQCNDCRKQFSVLVGTMMHGTHVPIRIWLMVMFDMASAKNGISSREVQRKYGVTAKTAWHLCHRIREAMRWDYANRFSGVVVADEAYIGGHPKNRHASKRVERDGRGTDKAPVVTILNDETGEVRSHVVTSVDGYTVGTIIAGNVDPEGSTLVTDQWKGYGPVGQLFAKHEQLDHSAQEFVRDGYSTNRVEGYFSQLKRSIDGTHHHVSRDHLHRYTSEFDFRASTHKMTDGERMAKLLRQASGSRLTYRDLKTKGRPGA